MTDWPVIIRELRIVGSMRYLDIAIEVGCSEATISDLVTGRSREPRHSLGVRLLALYAKVSREAVTGNSQVESAGSV